ncbi:hypothetical protein DM15PD_01630 [Aristophania vespae]|nr:hypothetical protein DM15PD_01630 [Aristophania vespae]
MAIIASHLLWPGSSLDVRPISSSTTEHFVKNNADDMQFAPEKYSLDKDFKDSVTLSEHAQTYLNSQQSKSAEKIYHVLEAASQVISSSTTSDAEKFAAISTAYHLFFENSNIGNVTGSFAVAWGKFKAATADSDFMKYYSVQQQFVPSISPTNDASIQDDHSNSWAQYFVNSKNTENLHDKTSPLDSMFSGTEHRYHALFPKMSSQDIKRFMVARNSIYARDQHKQRGEALFSFVKVKAAHTPLEKKILGKLLNLSERELDGSLLSSHKL